MLHSVIALFRQNTDYLWEPSQKAALKRNPFPLAGALLAILARYQTVQPAYALSQYRRNRRKRLVRKTLSKAPEVAKKIPRCKRSAKMMQLKHSKLRLGKLLAHKPRITSRGGNDF